MFELISRKLSEVNEEKATWFLERNTLESQRAIRPKKVKDLTEAIENGAFTTGNIAIAKKSFNGGEYVLVNGQHQCRAILDAGMPIIAVCEQWDCRTPSDLANLYRQYDNHAARSLGDIALPEAQSLGIDWPTRIISLVLTGAQILEGKTEARKNEKVELLKFHTDDGAFVNSIIGDHQRDSKHLMRGAVAAAMMMTWAKHPELADRFWKQVRDGEFLTAKMPAYKLRNYLMQVNVFMGLGARPRINKNAANSHEIRSKCIIAWNAYRRNQTTDLKYFADKPVPKPL